FRDTALLLFIKLAKKQISDENYYILTVREVPKKHSILMEIKSGVWFANIFCCLYSVFKHFQYYSIFKTAIFL
ncbi:hypothetical protein ACJX0J_008333, partial [Zea mays]